MVKRSRGPEAITQVFSLRKSYFAMLLEARINERDTDVTESNQ